jgi:protoporphyrinogen oxidase
MTIKVGIIGAGPAGITAAYCLAKKGIHTEVYEASAHTGGLARSFDLWGQRVDLGPHRFFSKDKRVNDLWLEVVGDDYEVVNRLTRIYYRQSFFHYPLKLINALINLGIVESVRCVTSFLIERIRPTPGDGSFESWVRSRFGKRLYEIFFKTYSEKLWGIPCNELDADFAAQRIKKLSMYEAIKNAIVGDAGSKHKTLVEQFKYPVNGTGSVYERMEAAIIKSGGRVHHKRPVARVITKNNQAVAIALENGQTQAFDHIISTMPVSLLVSRMNDVPEQVKKAAESLKFRNTILVYLQVDSTDLFPDNWLYIHSEELQMGRMTNFRNWVPQLYGNSDSSILVLEYWCNDEDEIWIREDKNLIELGEHEFRKTGLDKGAKISGGYVHRIHRCYPVYEIGYRDKLEPVEQFLSGVEHLQAIGRYGAFKYNNQDHSILMGMLAAENISGKNYDLWKINTDYDDYQEET